MISLWYCILHDVIWCGASYVGNGKAVKLLLNCVLGPEGRLVLGALACCSSGGCSAGSVPKAFAPGVWCPHLLF